MKVSRSLKIALNIIVWIALAVYLVFSARYCTERQKDILCKGVKISVDDSIEMGFITSGMVKQWLINQKVEITGKKLPEINTIDIYNLIISRGYVKSAEVFKTNDGYINIKIEQRRPIIRIYDGADYSIYITEDFYILPTQNYFTVDVPIVSGNLSSIVDKSYIGSIENLFKENIKKTKKDSEFLWKLTNFVLFLDESPFWRSEIVQININNELEIELTPRFGNHIIELGTVDEYESKLLRYVKFIDVLKDNDKWGSFNKVDLRYTGQIVCR